MAEVNPISRIEAAKAQATDRRARAEQSPPVVPDMLEEGGRVRGLAAVPLIEWTTTGVGRRAEELSHTRRSHRDVRHDAEEVLEAAAERAGVPYPLWEDENQSRLKSLIAKGRRR